MIRLELCHPFNQSILKTDFNFTMIRLERTTLSGARRGELDFNFTMIRLELCALNTNFPNPLPNFNFTMIRLELDKGLRQLLLNNAFQFHNDTIRTGEPDWNSRYFADFNFTMIRLEPGCSGLPPEDPTRISISQ